MNKYDTWSKREQKKKRSSFWSVRAYGIRILSLRGIATSTPLLSLLISISLSLFLVLALAFHHSFYFLLVVEQPYVIFLRVFDI